MMFEGKHIHFSPVDNKPLCSYSVKLCKQRRLNGYAFCIRHILEDKSAPFKQCAHVARYNNQKCTNPIPSNEDREFCNSHMQVAGMLPKKERKNKKEKERDLFIPSDGRLKFADKLRALLKKENSITNTEEKFNDDPYAFTDPISENGSNAGRTAISVARTQWNCSQKILDNANSENLIKNEMTQPKNNVSADCRSKSHAPKLSKTMNRLQAKIAENKLLDKLKKSQESSHQNSTIPTTVGSTITIKSEPLSPVAAFTVQNNSPKTNPVCGRNKLLNKLLGTSKNSSSTNANNTDLHSLIPIDNVSETSNINFLLSSAMHKTSNLKSQVTSKHQISKMVSPNGCSNDSKSVTGMVMVKPRKNKVTEIASIKVPPVLQRIEDFWQSEKKYCKDLYPLAFESSESEGSDSEEENHRLHHIQWISIWDRTTSGLHTNNTLTSRALQQCHLKKELGRGYEQLNRIHSLHQQKEVHNITLVHHLTEAAKWYPNRTAHLLLKKLKLVSRPKKIIKSVGLEKNVCCYQHDGVLCNKRSLPYTRHCDKHIMYNVDQLLFEHCTAKFSDNTQCCVPVFDICHELPLCPEHAKKRDNYNKMASEPKPKKPRKKSKPSALTRPPKRGKKKKRQNLLRPTPTSSPPTDQHLNSSQTELSKNVELDNVSTETENNVTNVVLTKDLGGNLDTELATDLEEQFSPGTIDKSLELPLDTVELANQATKLLEEHDFTEVLNKIPDDAFSDLFSEARNGEYIPSKEETEELERALAAVSKDVHLAKESLAKLSASGQDIDELASTIDIHSGLLSAENLAGAIDENAFQELAQGPMEGLGVISNSLSTSDLNSLSQALSSITSDNLAQSTLTTTVTEGHLHNPLATVPVLTSEVAHTQVLNGLTGIHTISPDSNFGLGTQFIEGTASTLNPVSTQNSVENRYLPSTPSLLSSILYGLGQNNSSSQTPYSPSQLPALNNSNSREEENLVTSTGGPTVANSSTHWLLNPSEQVLALSQMNYQNGFLVTSQAGGTYSGTQQLLTSVGKYPLQALSAEVSLVSSSTPLVTSTCSDSILCGASDELLHNLHVSNNAAGTLQQTNSATVIAQEGAS